MLARSERMLEISMRDEATAVDIVGWIEKLYVPDGLLMGRQFKLAPWQVECLEKIYDNSHGTRRAILSFPRKNGKTALCALLLLVHLCGPRARPNSQLYSAAQSRDQAALIFNLAAKIVRMSPALRDHVVVRDSTKALACPGLGTTYRALSADANTAYGLSPNFVIFDELGRVRGPRDQLFEALTTATGAQENPLAIIISTQAPTDGDLLSLLIDDALTGRDPRSVCKLYTAPLHLDPFDRETIALANPAFGDFLNPREVLAMADDARRLPSREAEFKNLILNMRVESCDPFVAPGLWKNCGGEVADISGRECYAGLDLSEAADLTALVVISRVDGIWHVVPTFWLPSEGIRERSRADHVQYDVWAEQGFVRLTPGNTVSYEYVAHYLLKIFAQYDIRKIGFDRWNFRHLKPWLRQAGFSEQMISERWVEFGQGTQSMSPALRELEEAILDRRLCHGDHPVLSMCAANSVVEGNDSSNRKLSKKRSTGRIDGMVALAMAIGCAPLRAPKIDVAALIA
jgi:phage terminase large subunit-like protein